MAFTLVTVSATYLEPDNVTPLSGSVSFQLTGDITDGEGGRILASRRKVAVLNGSGVMSVSLAATDDATTSPQNTVYLVTENFVGVPTNTYFIEVPSDSPTLNLAEAAHVQLPTPYQAMLEAAIAAAEQAAEDAVDEGLEGFDSGVVSVDGQVGVVDLTGIYVPTAGNSTITGTKTFSSAPVVPDASFTEAKVSGLVRRLTDRPVEISSFAATEAQAAALGIGNLLSKPLSNYYASLSEAQVDYPHATALTDELDWAVLYAGMNGAHHLILGQRRFRINRTLDLPGGSIIFSGSGALNSDGIRGTMIDNRGSGDLFHIPVNAAGVVWRDLTLIGRVNTGHIIGMADNAGLSASIMERCCINQQEASKSILHGTNVNLISTTWRKMTTTIQQTATVAAWDIKTGGGALNGNVWDDFFHSNSGNFVWDIQSTVNSTYAYDNTISNIVAEITNGGIVRLMSCYATRLVNINSYDMQLLGPTTRDQIYVGKHASGLSSKYTHIENCGRRGGSLGAGLNDIKLASGEAPLTFISGCDTSTLGGYTIDLGSNSYCEVDKWNGTGTLTNVPSTLVQTNVFGVQVPNLKLNQLSSLHSGTGVPASGLGANGDYYFRQDSAGFYQKLSGAWTAAGGTDALVVNSQTGTTYTFGLADNGALVTFNNASAVVVTVDTFANVALPTGSVISIAQLGAGQVQVVGASGVLINGVPGPYLRSQYSQATLTKISTNSWLLAGDLAS